MPSRTQPLAGRRHSCSQDPDRSECAERRSEQYGLPHTRRRREFCFLVATRNCDETCVSGRLTLDGRLQRRQPLVPPTRDLVEASARECQARALQPPHVLAPAPLASDEPGLP